MTPQRFMNDLLDLIVFSPDADQRARSGALAEMGFSPRRCEDSNGLFRLFQTRRTPLLVAEAELTDLCMAVAGLRAMDTTAGIVAISTFDSPENRILGLHCGADVCFQPTSRRPRSPRYRPWCRTPPSGRRHAEAETRAASVRRAAAGRWQFQDAAWTLVSRAASACPDPGRARIPAQADLGHGSACRAAPSRPTPGRPRLGAPHRRGGEPAAAQGAGHAPDLPIRTVWGWGYAFTGEI